MITIPAALILALIQVESQGRNDAVGDQGMALGCLQITQAVVTDVNRILKRGGMQLFRHREAFDRATAVFICQTYLKHYGDPSVLGRDPTAEDLARIWNCGPEFYLPEHKAKGDTYWVKVRTELIVQGAFNLAGHQPDPVKAETGEDRQQVSMAELPSGSPASHPSESETPPAPLAVDPSSPV